jgi:hypothetical protein
LDDFGQFSAPCQGSAEQDLQTSGGSAEASQGTQAPGAMKIGHFPEENGNFNRGHHGHRIFLGYPVFVATLRTFFEWHYWELLGPPEVSSNQLSKNGCIN